MEESLSLLQFINQEFACETVDIRTYSPLTLAYIGDAIYDVIIRTIIVERGNRAVNGLHKTASSFVRAETQAAMIGVLQQEFSPEEEAVYKRGRNAKSHTSAKNASIGDYKKATGLEALIGYLYLKDDMARILELVKKGIERLDMQI